MTAPIRQRQYPYGHGHEQNPQGCHYQVPQYAGSGRDLCARLGLPRSANRAQGRAGSEEKRKELPPLTVRRLCREYAQKWINVQRDEFKRLWRFWANGKIPI